MSTTCDVIVQGYSCVDLMNGGMRESGVYYLQIRGTTYWFLKVYCEQNVADGGWTVSDKNLNNLRDSNKYNEYVK